MPLSDELLYKGQPLSWWLNALHSDKTDVREQAALVWSQVGQGVKEAVPALVVSLRDSSDAVRKQAVEALLELAEQTQAVVPKARAAIKKAALADRDEMVRSSAAQALVQLGPQSRSEVPALVEELRDEIPAARAGAAHSLAELGVEAREAVGPLTSVFLWDANWLVRLEAAVALWRIDRRDTMVVPMFVEALKHEDELVRWIAADCLREIGPAAKEAVPALLKSLQDQFKIALIRESLVLALERIDPAAAASPGVR